MEAGLKPWEPLQLKPIHKQMIALSVTGMKNQDIADLTGYTEPRVSVILNDPRAKSLKHQLSNEFIQQLTADTQEVIQSEALNSVHTIVELRDEAKNENVRLGAAKDMLDRGGHKAAELSMGLRMNVEASDMKRLIEALRESKQEPETLEMVQDSSGVFRKGKGIVSARKE